MVLLQAVPLSAADPPGPTGTTARSSDQRIATLIRQLGDRSFQVRAEATRELCAIGASARPALHEAARGRDFEVALRAQALLEVLEELFFSGCRIEIAVSKRPIAWDEAIDLTLTVRGPPDAAAKLPFPPIASEDVPEHSDARQVAGLLDLADFLEVVGPDRLPVAFHLDLAGADPAVETVVRRRAESPPVARLSAGETRTYRVAGLNRGRARYALLRPGAYRITFAYEPEWEDEEFNRAGIGALRSNTVEVAVTRGAPAAVVGPGSSPTLTLAREGAAVTARMQNRRDVLLWINMNFAWNGPPFALFRWLVYDGQDWRDHAPARDPVQAKAFSRERLVELAPGEQIELGRADLAALRTHAGIKDGEPLFVRASYSNLCDRAWQRRHRPDLPALQEPLPPGLLTTTLAGEPLRID